MAAPIVLAAGQALIGMATGWFSSWQKRRERQERVEEAVTENKIRLATDAQTHNANWEMAALEGRDNFMRRVSFVMWSAPFLWALFDPVGVREFFTVSLAVLPEWYVAGYLGMTGAIWGLAELKARGVLK